MSTAEKSYDAWQAPHFRTEAADLPAQEADLPAEVPDTPATEVSPPSAEAAVSAPEAPKAGLLAQVAGLLAQVTGQKAEEAPADHQSGGTADQLTDEEKRALSIAPQGFNAPNPLQGAAPESSPTAPDAGNTTTTDDEDEDAESEMIREASPFVRELIGALKTVYDPEIPVDIFELGLIYKIDVDDDKNVKVDMTLTAPGCPVAGEMPIMVENAIKSVEGVKEVDVNMVFDPPWTPDKMSEEAQLSLNMF